MGNVFGLLRSYLPLSLIGSVQTPRHRLHTTPVLQPVGLHDFLNLSIAPREMLLSPILPARSLSMLYAPRGIGKTLLGLSIALAVSSGASLLRWSAPKPRRVLYIDGEMPLADLQDRLSAISIGLGAENQNGRFQILVADQT